jgi:hypothetical protein
MKSIRAFLLLATVLLATAWSFGLGAYAQEPSEPCASMSFTQLFPDAGAPLSYTVPLHYGTFADVEVGSATSSTVQLAVDVFEKSVLKERRIWVLVPGRVVLVSDLLDVENLFEIGTSLLVRLDASAPVSAMLVRQN